MCKQCPCCGGKGFTKSEETIRLDVERKIKKLAMENKSKAFLIKLHPSIASLIIGKSGKNLKNLESITKRYLAIKSEQNIALDSFIIEAEGSMAEIIDVSKPFKVGDIMDIVIEEPYSHNRSDGLARLQGYVVQVVGGRKYIGSKVTVEITAISKTSAVAVIK